MHETKKNRRDFLTTVGAVGAASILVGSGTNRGSYAAEGAEKLAIEVIQPRQRSRLRNDDATVRLTDQHERFK